MTLGIGQILLFAFVLRASEMNPELENNKMKIDEHFSLG
jgi:hypothetical protein